jgi:chromosome segregation ATPase
MTQLAMRTPDLLAVEINSIREQVQKTALIGSIEIGNRLIEAKALIGHGEWGEWLEHSVSYSQRTANNLMKIAEEYGSNLQLLFGENSNSQALANLTYTQAVALLGVPSDEREDFVKDHDLESMTTRELEQAVKDRKELERLLRESKEKEQIALDAHQKISQKHKDLESKSKELNETVERLNSELEDAQASGDEEAIEKAQADLKKSKEANQAAMLKIKELEEELKKKPIEVPAVTEKIVEVIPESVTKELADLKDKLTAEQEKLIKSEEKLSRNNNKAMVKYSVLFESLKQDHNELIGVLGEIKSTDPEAYEKYKKATLALLSVVSENI